MVEKNLILELEEIEEVKKSGNAKEIIIALSPSFGVQQTSTIIGMTHYEVIKQLAAGIEEEGFVPRFVKYYSTSDLSAFASMASKLSESGISIGVQSKGTCVIHQKDLEQLDNLELFPQAPLYTGEIYRKIGRNAARYGKNMTPEPVPTLNDQMSLAKYQVKAALLHLKETELVIEKKKPMDLKIKIVEKG